uniref:Uncharacterized protein n=1 Tax=viral metagenome TaxID=1070528 RepID=A0A6C0EQX8_9ZZZZ
MQNFLSNFLNNYFGALSKDYCVYFYALSILFFILFIISSVSIGLSLIKKPSEVLDLKFLIKSTVVLSYTFIPYLVNRLLHTMCVNSVF